MKHPHKRELIVFSCGLNLLLFLLAFAFHPPVWATNDDYRMSVILSGAYLGEPSPDAVFLQQPLGVLLAGLYSIFPSLPVYGIYTELALYVSCCVICYALADMMARRGKPLLMAACVYLVLYILALRKYVIMPQFTLTSAYMTIAAAVLVYRLPLAGTSRKAGAVLAALLSLFAFMTRAKVFYLLLPVIAAVILWHALLHRKLCGGHGLYLLLTGASIAVCLTANTLHWQQAHYAAYKEFNTARSRVYDYGEIPFFYDEAAFYLENGIDETLYRQIAARYLDMDARLNADVLNTVADRIAETSTGGRSPLRRILEACANSMGSWFSTTDGSVAYTAAYVLGALAICAARTLLRQDEPGKQQPPQLFLILFAGLLLENIYFLYIGRVMTRQLDTLLITATVLGTLILVDAWPAGHRTAQRDLPERLIRRTALLAASAVCLCVLAGAGREVSANHAAALNRNAKLETLQDLAAANPDNFYFYDTQYFISSTDDVFQVYDTARPLNAESLGSWNVGSPAYLQRNRMMGFTSAIEGLTQRDNVYFVAITEPRLAMTRTLMDLYNMELVLVEQLQASNCTLYVYSAVDAD